jgi:hypothetical protein
MMVTAEGGAVTRRRAHFVVPQHIASEVASPLDRLDRPVHHPDLWFQADDIQIARLEAKLETVRRATEPTAPNRCAGPQPQVRLGRPQRRSSVEDMGSVGRNSSRDESATLPRHAPPQLCLQSGNILAGSSSSTSSSTSSSPTNPRAHYSCGSSSSPVAAFAPPSFIGVQLPAAHQAATSHLPAALPTAPFALHCNAAGTRPRPPPLPGLCMQRSHSMPSEQNTYSPPSVMQPPPMHPSPQSQPLYLGVALHRSTSDPTEGTPAPGLSQTSLATQMPAKPSPRNPHGLSMSQRVAALQLGRNRA